MLAGGAEVVLSGCVRLLLVEAVWKQQGVGYCHGHVCAASMVLSRAKAFTDVLMVGMVAVPLGRRFPAGGTMARHHVLRSAGLLG